MKQIQQSTIYEFDLMLHVPAAISYEMAAFFTPFSQELIGTDKELSGNWQGLEKDRTGIVPLAGPCEINVRRVPAAAETRLTFHSEYKVCCH